VPPAELIDGSAADFARGCTDAGAYVARTGAGEVILSPTAAAEFTGDVLPEGWTVTPWAEGGTGTLGDGMLALDGARIGCDPLLLSPRSLEMSAVFAARPDQHVGLGTDLVDVPWVMFSTKWGRRLYARTHLLSIEDKKLDGHWFGAPHVFRIDWNILDLVFSVDGARVAHLMIPMPHHMRALAGNQRVGTEPLRVEWMRISPYASAGRFTSRILDAGTEAAWNSVAWDADAPDGTSLAVQVRTGHTPRPGRSWGPWKSVARSGDAIVATSRYIQYRVDLATANPSWTPLLRSVRLAYSAAGSAAGGPSGSGAGSPARGGGSAGVSAAGGGASSSSLVSGRTLGCQ